MNLTKNFLNILSVWIQLVSLIYFLDFLGIIFKKQIKKNRLVLSLTIYFLTTIIFYFFYNKFSETTRIVAVIFFYASFTLTLYIMTGIFNSKIIYFIALFDLSVSLAKTSVSNILANLFNANARDISPFVMIFIQTALLIIILFVMKKNNAQRNISVLEMIPRHIYIMLMTAIICLSALSSLISLQTDNEIKKDNTLTTIVIILTVIFLGILLSLFLNVIAKQHFTAVSQMMEKQVELQIDHYEKLEKMNAEISRFRHDYTNHLRSILSLIQMREYSQAEEYIEKLQKTKIGSAAAMFYTGNKLADAILADKSAALGDNCRIEYSGIIPTSIENVDLCVILSNALDNAVEACRELTSPCVISIFAGTQQGYFVMSVKNPTACDHNFYDIPPTTKPEKERHGMGLYNIENTVKKYDGQIKVKCENGVFELIATMKI